MAASLTSATALPSQPGPVSSSKSGKYLVFRLAHEEFAVPVHAVREIVGLADITSVPHTPDYVRGVMNLRGKVVPVIDLRLRLGVPAKEVTGQACVVVLHVHAASGPMVLGVLVDAVSEVLLITPPDIEEPPQFEGQWARPHVLGLAKIRGTVKILLDIDEVLKGTDLDMPSADRLAPARPDQSGA